MALGRTLIIKVTDGADAFSAVCVQENRGITINNERIDTTLIDCTNPGGKLKYNGIYGAQSVSFTGDGTFVNEAAYKRVMLNAFNQVIEAYQVVVPGVGTFEGDALIENGSFDGSKTGELQASFSATMTGDITFTAEA